MTPPLGSEKDSDRKTTIYRRDLFDARFQELLEVDDHDSLGESPDQGIVNPLGSGPDTEKQTPSKGDERKQKEKPKEGEGGNSLASNANDLIPGVYEGGFKTWECSLDLVATLEELWEQDPKFVQGKSSIEIGCGTALPSVYLLQKLFNSERRTSTSETDQANSSSTKTRLHLCDFNSQVLRLVTLPNLILAWYFSESSQSFRSHQISLEAASNVKPKKKEDSKPITTGTEGEEYGDLELTEDLLEAFEKSLVEYEIELKFFYGSWEGINPLSMLERDEKYELILTSETIYSLKTLPSLIQVLKLCSSDLNHDTSKGKDEDLSKRLAETNLSTSTQTLCLVAAKILYFGVGGGVQSFQSLLETDNGRSEEVRRVGKGVGRIVLKVEFE